MPPTRYSCDAVFSTLDPLTKLVTTLPCAKHATRCADTVKTDTRQQHYCLCSMATARAVLVRRVAFWRPSVFGWEAMLCHNGTRLRSWEEQAQYCVALRNGFDWWQPQESDGRHAAYAPYIRSSASPFAVLLLAALLLATSLLAASRLSAFLLSAFHLHNPAVAATSDTSTADDGNSDGAGCAGEACCFLVAKRVRMGGHVVS